MTDRRNPLAGINLNLFAVLDAMLRHRSVTRAARELGVTPSAVSHSLRDLRTLLDDPLFARSGTGMMPTRRATEIEAALRGAMGALGDVVQRRAAFDPAAARRVFTLATSDEASMALLPRGLSTGTKYLCLPTLSRKDYVKGNTAKPAVRDRPD